MHYGFDRWMTRTFPGVQFERFADDVVIHCGTEREARQVRVAVGQRFAEIGLEVHPDKTRIVYCKDSNRRREYEQVTFTFCGYTFRPREAINRRGQVFTAFLPAVSPEKLNEMSRRIRSWRLHRRINLTLADLAKVVNPVLRGWLNCFTAFYPSAVSTLCRRIDRHLVRWARWKYKRLKRAGRRARAWLQGVRERAPLLFAHWAVRDG